MWYFLSTTALATALAVTPSFSATDLGHSTNGHAPGERVAVSAYLRDPGTERIWVMTPFGLKAVYGQPGNWHGVPANDNHAPGYQQGSISGPQLAQNSNGTWTTR